MQSLVFLILFFFMGISNTIGQTKGTSIQKKFKNYEKYLFYLHGGIIQAQGIGAVSPYWGPYEYTAILDTLKAYGYNVISEARPKGTGELEYADKIAKQIDTLFKAGVAPEDIIVVGASAGGSIAIDISIRVKNSKIKYAVLGVCRWASWKAYLHENELCGNFLSIYESSDTYGSCEGYFKDQPCKSGFKEIKLNMNNGHGFLYKPYKEWVYPLVKWIDAPQAKEVEEMSRQNDRYDSHRNPEG